MPNLKSLMFCGDKEKSACVWASLRYFLIIALLLAAACAENGYQAVQKNIIQIDQVKPTMSTSEARQKIKELLVKVPNPFGGYKNVRVTTSFFSFFQPGGRLPAGSTNLNPVNRCFFFKDMNNVEVEYESTHSYLFVMFTYANKQLIGIAWGGSEQAAKVFVDAINTMKYYSSGAGSAEITAELAAFKEKAKAWRALPVKPSLPTEANRYRVLAEDAFKSKEFYKAIDYYEKALEVYPLWPEGQFNAALICGETGAYAEAVGHMQRYLELVPDAKDAKAAREKIYIWEVKAKE